MFGKLVVKHTDRISSYEDDRHFFLKFFDVPSFIIMAVMMTGGISIRAFGLAPEVFIAVFYTGLGTDRHFFLKFFDVPSFIIMAVMMTGGISIRAFGLAPEVFIAVFYTGLGTALALAGVRFGWNWLHARPSRA